MLRTIHLVFLFTVLLLEWSNTVSAQQQSNELLFSNKLRISDNVLSQSYQYRSSTSSLLTGTLPQYARNPVLRYDRLIEQSAYVGVIQGAGITLLTTLPEKFTNFNKDKLRKDTPLRTWEKHVSHMPVVDNDTFLVNASHAFLAGSGYHVVCRNLQYSLAECFVYSSIMSTIHEYFVEAFPEPPSIQDLIVTPVGGFIIGELLYVLNIHHPMLFVVNVMESVLGPTVQRHNIRFSVSYGNTGVLLDRSHRSDYREMLVQIKGKF